MSKGAAATVGVVIGLSAALGVVALLGGGGGQQGLVKTPHPVTISVDSSGACSIKPMPVAGLNSGVGDYVVWQQADGKPFTVTFPSGNTTFNTGSPFVNRLGSGWQTIFPSANGASYQTGQANRNGWEVITFVHDFYIQSITVDGKTCYDRQKNPIEDMKVIIDK